MAPIAKSLALAGAVFSALSSAAPLQKRDDVTVWETTTAVEWTTVDITTTISPPSKTGSAKTSVIPVITTPTAEPQAQAPASQPAQFAQAEESSTSTAAPASTEVPTTTAAPAPLERSTSEQERAVTTIVAQAKPAANANSGSSSSGGSDYNGSCSKDSPCKGQVTFYDTATSQSAPSSCGWTNDGETESVIALPHGIMKDSDCGRTVTINYGGIKKTGKVVDKCMGCDSSSIDLSRHFFGELAAMTAGRLFGVEWFME